jgi:23S rRNA (cytidine1920-2'-O)/16S rRNA (cytidine1409-2'-O)-methyltransferase
MQVFGIDVGHGQVASRIADNPRVVVMEKFNLRDLKPQDVPCKVCIACKTAEYM